jgi:hypothetical protein
MTRGRYSGAAEEIENGSSSPVSPGDDLQSAYDQLKSSNNDSKMGVLSANNRRALLLAPGTYTMSDTVLLDTDYVDVLELVEGTVTLAKSGNGMGFAILPDIDAVVINADDRGFVGRYSRNSEAFTEQLSLGINEIKDKSMPVAGIVSSMDEDSANSFVGNTQLRIAYASETLGRVFGSRSGADFIGTSLDNSLPYSSQGQAVDLTTIAYLFPTDDLGNCVCTEGTTGGDNKVFYGTWTEGSTSMAFTRAKLDGGDFSLSATGVTTAHWSYLLTSAGTSLMSEYLTPGRFIYRSTDKGHNWSTALDPGAGVITHWHGMGQLEATGRIIACSGDNVKSNIYFSDDDGVTWAELTTIGQNIIQPIALQDIGHPTKLLCADDTQEGLFLLDVYSGEATPIFKDQDRVTLRGFFFTLMQNDGIIYAGTYDTTPSVSGSTNAIYATTDLVNWTCIYRAQAVNTLGWQSLVWFDGQILAALKLNVGGMAHVTITPPESVSSRKGVTCELAITNQLTIPGNSSYEDGDFLDYVSSESATIEQVTAGTADIPSIPNGTYAIRCSRGDNQTIFATRTAASAFGVAVSEADIVSGSIMVGLPTTAKPTMITVRFCKDDGDPATNTALDASLVTNAVLRPGEWKTLYIKPTLVDAADGDILGIRIGASVDVGTNTDILIDNVQISADGDQSSSWQIGGTPRAAAKYDLNWNTAEKGTHIFTFTPFAQSSWYDAIGGDFYIRSWRISTTIFADLYYDSDDQKFKLHVVSGAANDLVATAALWFKKGQAIVFAVQFGDDGDSNIHLSVGHGRTIETVDGAAEDYSALGLADILVRWGDIDAANGMNGTIHDLDLTGVMTASDIVSYIDSLIGS